MVVRTKLVDDLIQSSIEEGCDRVLNLAAGFDTRPYRMTLPETLEWVEADVGKLLDEKEKLLQDEKPRCLLRRERVDLGDASARDAFLREATAGAANVLVVTEGLLGYLDETAVSALSRALAQAKVRWWAFDVAAPANLELMRKGMGVHLTNAPMHFAPCNGVAFFEARGWAVTDMRSVVREAARLRRAPFLVRIMASLKEPDPRKPGKAVWSAVARIVRADPTNPGDTAK
jgi:methyltransferase (TIGR00027 family)